MNLFLFSNMVNQAYLMASYHASPEYLLNAEMDEYWDFNNMFDGCAFQ